jgi:uncharacterized protein YceK
MKSTIRCILISLVMLVMAGCASEYNYTPPTKTAALNNSIVVDKSKDEVWKEIVPALGKTFFVINNLDKESGLINISYSGDPEKYVDCGRIHSLVSNLAGERTYNFPASKAHQQYELLNNTVLWNIVRKMDLDGRMNIIVEELGPKQTKITANARYVLTRSVTQTGYQGYPATATDTISFNSGQRGQFSQGTICQCSGKFEEEVLSLLVGSKK